MDMIIFISAVFATGILMATIGLTRLSAPATAEERKADDEAQIRALEEWHRNKNK